MTRHSLDGNAIAADAHYGQDSAFDFHECEICGAPFGDPVEDDDCVKQDENQINLCDWCAQTIDDGD